MERTSAVVNSERIVSYGLLGAGLMLLVLVRMEPTLSSDAGVFFTMFDGVLDGDRLYVDRWDHKDPGFYWLGAMFVALFGVYGPTILDVLCVTAIGLAAFRWSMLVDNRTWPALFIGLGAAGFVTNPAFHATALSEPPALAVLLWAYVANERRRTTTVLVLVGALCHLEDWLCPACRAAAARPSSES